MKQRIVLILAALVLAACGGSTTVSPTTVPTTVAVAPTTVPATTAPTTVPATSVPATSVPTVVPATSVPTIAATNTTAPTTAAETATSTGEIGGDVTRVPDAATSTADGTATTDESVIESISGVLGTFDSYRLTIRISFQGADTAGVTGTQTLEIVQEKIKNPDSSRTQIQTQGNVIDVYSVGGKPYTVVDVGGQKTCSAVDSGIGDMSENFNPDEITGGFRNPKLVKKGEEVNGITTDHYELNQTEVTDGEQVTVVGDVWVAQDGGYPVKMEVDVTGANVSSGLGGTGGGPAKVEFNLDQIDNVDAITLPASCPAS